MTFCFYVNDKRHVIIKKLWIIHKEKCVLSGVMLFNVKTLTFLHLMFIFVLIISLAAIFCIFYDLTSAVTDAPA